jgi:endonuclease YncB( thermonuclease family)
MPEFCSYSEAGGMPKSLSVLTVRQILLVCVCALVLPSAASARTWPARFVSINDGDTIDARVGGRVFTIRLSGIQAMEQHTYSSNPKRRTGECNAVEATARLEQLIRESHGRLRLSAQYASSHAGYRLRRNVAVRIGGRWRDTGQILIREGHALWMSGKDEDRWNRAYNEAEQRARLDGRGLWDPTHCGSGPYQDVPLRLWVNWDPPGIDSQDVNGEFIKIQNQGNRTVELGGWWVRDSLLRRYTFAPGAQVAPGRTVTVHVGHGTNSADTFYWGLNEPAFENAHGEGRDRGDGGYLFDPHGDLRAAMVYPCLVACSDPNQGALQVTAHPRRPESVAVRNVSDHSVDLYGYELAIHGSAYSFGEWPPLAPGQTVEVDVDGDPGEDTALRRSWGLNRLVLPDAGGWVRVQAFSDITLACEAWGSGSC